jgi:hypothetical protein
MKKGFIILITKSEDDDILSPEDLTLEDEILKKVHNLKSADYANLGPML